MNRTLLQIRATATLILALMLIILSACSDADLEAPVIPENGTPQPTRTPALPTTATPDRPPTATREVIGGITPSPTVVQTTYAVAVTVDPAAHHLISPLIYGIADTNSGDEDLLNWLGVKLVRWGGNARTRHNWEINASNAGSDWEFRNVSQGDKTPGSASRLFMDRNRSVGAQSILSIPTIGWVAKDGNNDTRSVNPPGHGGPPIKPGSDSAFTDFLGGRWIKQYDPTANRTLTSLPSFPSKGSAFSYPPDLKDGKVYQDEWVAYLRSVRPAGSPAPIYSMDNEPELWADDTHVDVHPVRPGYDDEVATFLAYARAVKAADPDARVSGPESWGVTGYLFSALDAGDDSFETASDRAAHDGLPWLAWFLKATQAADQTAGKRSLDILSVHYYPNAGQYNGGNDPVMQDKRMQAPRALWDGLYSEPSWVARTEWGHLALLGRMHQMVNQFYPGTRIGISEWNYGGADDISGAIATADTLGIYGREDVYFATYWGALTIGQPTGWAFRLFRNYDGQGATFGSESVTTTSDDQDNTFTAYGALNDTGSQMTVLLINKDRTRVANTTITPGAFTATNAANVYRYGPAKLDGIVAEPLVVSDPAAVPVSVPPMSMALVVLDGSAGGSAP